MTYSLHTDLSLHCPLDDAFALFCDASNLERLTPPELRFQILTPLPIEMKRGARIQYRIRLFGVPFAWLTEITHWEPGVRFVDEQISGPFARWVHEHRFSSLGPSTSRIVDDVRYALPFEPVGRLAHPLVRARLDRIFEFREQRVREILEGGKPSNPSREPSSATDESSLARNALA